MVTLSMDIFFSRSYQESIKLDSNLLYMYNGKLQSLKCFKIWMIVNFKLKVKFLFTPSLEYKKLEKKVSWNFFSYINSSLFFDHSVLFLVFDCQMLHSQICCSLWISELSAYLLR